LKGVLLEPGRTFREASQQAGIGWALLYWFLFATVGTLFGIFWSIVTNAMWLATLTDIADRLPPEADRFLEAFGGPAAGAGIFYVFALPVYLILGLISLFLVAGIIHLFLLLVGGANRGFEATFRVVAYAGGSTALFNIFPLCGGLVGLVWGIVVQILGLKELHETSGGKAALAVFGPLLLCCACCILVVVLLFSLGVMSGLGGM
jgi:hypothetical protein